MNKREVDRVDNSLLTPSQTASLLGIKTESLCVWRSTGRYPLPYIKIGRKVMYRASDIEAFIQQRTCMHTGEYALNNPPLNLRSSSPQ